MSVATTVGIIKETSNPGMYIIFYLELAWYFPNWVYIAFEQLIRASQFQRPKGMPL